MEGRNLKSRISVGFFRLEISLAIVIGFVMLLSPLFFFAWEDIHGLPDKKWNDIEFEDDNFIADDEKLLCLSSAKILHKADHLRKGVPEESICRFEVPKSVVYELKGDIRIHGNSSLVFRANSEQNEMFKVRPYPRNCDIFAMDSAREFSIKSTTEQNDVPQCTSNHSYRAIIFSIAGYSVYNFFHGFSDELIPLFLTAHRYNKEVQFLVSGMNPWWVHENNKFFTSLSRYEIIDIDKQNGNEIRCYKSVTMGLYSHREFYIDPLMPPLGYTFENFTEFLRKSYSLKRHDLSRNVKEFHKKPKLLLISRERTRMLLNANETASMASQIGFRWGLGLENFAQIVNSCDVILGIHGAGLANLVFLLKNAVVIQIIPWGKLEGISRCAYAFTLPKAKLKYLEYQISLEESTLKKYGRDHPYIRNPFSLLVKG